MDKSRARRARLEQCMAKQDVALVSLKLTKLVLNKYGNTVAKHKLSSFGRLSITFLF